jgi:hypothetical protein
MSPASTLNPLFGGLDLHRTAAGLPTIFSFILKKLPRLDLQPVRDTGDVIDRHVALRSLHRTQIGPVDP